jgi:hypothetical protein
MPGVRPVSVPATEPVLVTDAQDFLKVPRTQDTSLITGLIAAARQYAEDVTSRSLASKDYVMVMDAFPYYTDTVASQQAYPPSYYSLPRYSTTLWNYSQLIKLPKAPVTKVSKITYIGTDGYPHDLFPGVDFIVDYENENCRIFTLPGAFWPAVRYVANAVTIFFTAGYDPDPLKVLDIPVVISPTVLPDPPQELATQKVWVGVPQKVRLAILMLVNHWYFNREPVVAGTAGSVPNSVDALLASETIFDFSPTRG